MNNLKLKKLVKESLKGYEMWKESQPKFATVRNGKVEIKDKVSIINPTTKEKEIGIVKNITKSPSGQDIDLTVSMENGESLLSPAKFFTKIEETELDEVKVSAVKKGDTFTLGADLGKFKKGDKVEIIDKKPEGDDIKLTLYNGKIKDIFYLDKNDDIEELNEGAIATDYQFTPKQLELIKKYGGKLSTGGNDLYIPDTLKIQLDQNVKDSKFKQEFYETFGPERKNLAAQLMTAMKLAMKKGGRAKIKNSIYHVIKGHMTKSGNFNFPNPSRLENK
jgi:hypothetical protein